MNIEKCPQKPTPLFTMDYPANNQTGAVKPQAQPKQQVQQVAAPKPIINRTQSKIQSPLQPKMKISQPEEKKIESADIKPSINKYPSKSNIYAPRMSEDTSIIPQKPKVSVSSWPSLSIENINTTFKVVGDLSHGSKVKIIDDRYLAEDNSYLSSLSRYNSGQSREKIMGFLDHLFDETKQLTLTILANIRSGADVDNNVSILENTTTNMMVFLHRYDVMRDVYKCDTGTYARLGVTRNKFFTFRHSLFRDLAIPK